jgi:hypothetical protein
MKRFILPAALFATAVLVFAPIASIAANDSPLPLAATVVGDDVLSTVRGKYIAPAIAGAPSKNVADRGMDPGKTFAATVPGTGANESSALSGLNESGGGQVTYFGLQMASSWENTGANGVTRGVSAGANLSIDLQTGTITDSTWSNSQNGGLPDGSSSGTVGGLPPATNVSTGVGQSVQVAGNGNTVSNQTVVQIGSNVPVVSSTGSGNTCGSACQITIGPNGIDLAIAGPQGSVSQAVGPNGISQSAQIYSNMNAITNQLGVQVRIAPSGALSGGDLNVLLQTLSGLH